MRSWFRVGVRLGVLAGAVFAVLLAARSRRNGANPAQEPGRVGSQPGGPGRATGVHGEWPDVPHAPAPAAGDHHPHGRVTVPREAAPMGAPPAVAGDRPGPAEPEAPEPREHLDEGRSPGPAPTKKAPAKKAAAPAASRAPAARKAPGPRKAPSRPAGGAAVAGSGEPAVPAPPWVAPEGKACPPTHPVKAKLASRLYHLPGMLAYDRTVPDRCYVDAGAAEADGFQRAKR